MAAAQISSLRGARGGGVFDTTYKVVSGNGVNPDFDNTGLPDVPAAWGPTSLAVVLGAAPPSGAALRGHTHLNNRTGYIERFDFYVASDAAVDDTFASVAVGKGISVLDYDDPSVPIAFYVKLTKIAGERKLQIDLPTDSGAATYTWSGVVELQTAYTLYIEYSLVFGRTLFTVNGQEVVNVAHDASAVQSIGTLVLGSSGGSTARNMIYLIDRVLETPLPDGGRAPTGMSVTTPSSGATDVPVSATFVCAEGTDVDTYEIRYETVNPPVGTWTSLGASRSIGPVSLANNTTYYVQCRGTNENGTSTSSVSSFTTVAATSTGTHPALLINATRLARWAQMKSDYTASATTPKCTDAAYTNGQKLGCLIYKNVLEKAQKPIGADLTNEGLEEALMANVDTANAVTWCANAYSKAVSTGILHYSSGSSVAGDGNAHRELFTDWVLIYDWCYQQWDQTKRNTYLTRLNDLTVALNTTYAPGGWRCGDVDQPIGDYYGMAALYYATKSYNPTIVTQWADDDIGGITASALLCDPTTSPSRTLRNEIGYYYGTPGPADGGAWFQGTEYSTEAYLGVIGCEAVRTTEAGNAPCTEIDAWVDDWARYYTHRMSRDYQGIYQSADNQEPHDKWVGRFRFAETEHYLTLAALLPDNSDRQHMWRQFLNFWAINGTDRIFPGTYPARGMMLGDPYITAASDLTALPKCYESSGYGLYTWNGSWTGVSSEATQFAVHFKSDLRIMDHWTEYFGDIYLRRKGEFAITHPYSYAGVAGLLPEGTNTVSLEGLGPAPGSISFTGKQYKQANGFVCGSDYMYVAGTTGGAYRPPQSYDGLATNGLVPEHYVDEYTREVVYLASAADTIDTIYVLDRAAVKDPQTLARYASYGTTNKNGVTCTYPPPSTDCYSGLYVGSNFATLIQYFGRWQSYLFQWVTTAPTIVGNKTTWTLNDGQLAEDNWLTPDAVTITAQDMDLLTVFTHATPETTDTLPDESDKWRTIVTPNSNVDWNVMARVISVRDPGVSAPTVTELSVTGTCIATLISRTGNNDVIIVNNSAQGDLIPQQYPTSAQATAVLATARFNKAKTCTIPWTQTTATAKVLVLDLNPALGWTSNLDGAGAVAITEDSSGLEELSISGTGAHSLVVVGS